MTVVERNAAAPWLQRQLSPQIEQQVIPSAQAAHPGWNEFVLRFADSGILPFNREMLKPLLDGLTSEN
jgi:hypothetical protein